MVLNYNVVVINVEKLNNILKSLASKDRYTHFIQESDLNIYYASDLIQAEIDEVDAVINTWQDFTNTDNLINYLEKEVHPFTKYLMYSFAAENINLGITQAGKTEYVLGLFSKKYAVPSLNLTLPVSLKECFDTGSLYSARSVIQKIRDNPLDYSGLSPYVTDARLLKMKNDIETFLGIPLSS